MWHCWATVKQILLERMCMGVLYCIGEADGTVRMDSISFDSRLEEEVVAVANMT